MKSSSLLGHTKCRLSLWPLTRVIDFLWPLFNSVAVKGEAEMMEGSGPQRHFCFPLKVLSPPQRPLCLQLIAYNSQIKPVNLSKSFMVPIFFYSLRSYIFWKYRLCPSFNLFYFCMISFITVLFMCFNNETLLMRLLFSPSLQESMMLRAEQILWIWFRLFYFQFLYFINKE